MLSSIPISIIIGTILGSLAGLGVGGGSILILWLTEIIGFDANTARVINLAFFITAAGSASLLRLKKRQIPWRRILPAVLSGCVMALIASQLSRTLDGNIIRKLFGCLLLITGIREIFYRDK